MSSYVIIIQFYLSLYNLSKYKKDYHSLFFPNVSLSKSPTNPPDSKGTYMRGEL